MYKRAECPCMGLVCPIADWDNSTVPRPCAICVMCHSALRVLPEHPFYAVCAIDGGLLPRRGGADK